MIDVSVMSNEELSKIITEAKAELEQREYAENERAWDRCATRLQTILTDMKVL